MDKLLERAPNSNVSSRWKYESYIHENHSWQETRGKQERESSWLPVGMSSGAQSPHLCEPQPPYLSKGFNDSKWYTLMIR